MHIKENFMILRDVLSSFPSMIWPTSMIVREIVEGPGDVKIFYMEPQSPFTFEAGQYGIWFLPVKVRGKPARMFSIASSPDESRVMISTHIRTSDYKQKLANLVPGDVIKMRGPIGRFTLDANATTHIMIAGGIGITPIRGLLASAAAKRPGDQTVLVYSGSGNYLFDTELKQCAKESYFVSRDTLPGTMNDQIERYSNGATYYVSGSPAFVSSIESQLNEKGVTNIKRDGFLGY